jgi:hypothetical protein
MEIVQFNVYIEDVMNQLIIYNLKNPRYMDKFTHIIRMPTKIVNRMRECDFCHSTDNIHYMFIKSSLLTGYGYCKGCVHYARACIRSYDFNFSFPNFHKLYEMRDIVVIRSCNILDGGWVLPDETKMYMCLTGEYLIELYKDPCYNSGNITLYNKMIVMDIYILMQIQ